MRNHGWVLLVLCALGCSSSGPSGTPGPDSGVTGVTVNAPAKVTSGLRFQLQATVLGTASNKSVVWSVVQGGGTLRDASANPATYVAPLVTSVTTVRLKATSVADSGKSGTFDVEVDPMAPLATRVDTSLAPAQPSLPDAQGNPVAVVASRDERGIRTDFLVGQARIKPRSQSELNDFLQRYQGTVIGDDTIPEPPARLGISLTAEQRAPTEYLVRINLSRVDPSTFPADAAVVGLGGPLEFSSQDAMLSMAAVANAVAQGFSVSPNYVEYPGAFPRTLISAKERPDGLGGFVDPFTAAGSWSRFWTTGSQSNATLAWQFIAAHGIARRVLVAILDGGFWLNTDGTPRGTDTDLPANPIQYDFQADDYLADGPNPNNCTGGSSCFWHGNDSAGVATGIMDNSQGAVGTGGLVADPMLFKFTGAKDQRNRAVRTAVAWQADVLSMSFGGDCNKPCRIYDRDHTPFDDAINGGSKIVFVASAGNGAGGIGYDVGDEDHDVHPCIEDHVICVGALADDLTTPIGYSNFGAAVEIWAPTNIPVMSTPAGNDNNPSGPAAPHNHTGTSASAPFVAGVVAMMKAVNPGLDNDTIATMLRDTAHHGASPVDRYVDAYAAVRRAAQGIPGVNDRFEPNNADSAATPIGAGPTPSLSLQTDSDRDYLRIDLATRSRITVQLASMDGLGKVWLSDGYGLEASTLGCGAFQEVSTATAPNSQTLVYDAPAGSYLLDISGKLNAYDVVWNSTPLAAVVPAPDAYEPDDTNSQAVDVKHGLDGHATLTPGDVDVFRITSTGTIDSPYLHASTGFHVYRTDVPVKVALFDSLGFPLGTQLGSANCQGGVGFGDLPQGTFYAKVTALTPGAQGSYQFYGGSAATGGVGPVHDRVYERLHPGDPVEGVIRDRFKGYIFTLGPQVDQLGLLAQSPVHVQILDVQGNVLVEGQPTQNPRIPGYIELLSLNGLAIGTDYLIQLTRMSAQSDTAPPSVPGVAFTMGWSEGSPTRDSGNLVLNGDAEDGNQGASDTGDVVPLRFWDRPAGSNLTVVFYNAVWFPTDNDPGPNPRGHHLFAGGPGVVSSSADQTVDLGGNYASWFPSIDAGKATFLLSGWLGGYIAENDGATLSATFLDQGGQVLASVTIGPVLSAERDGLRGLFYRQTDGLVPPGTRRIALHLAMTRTDGTYDDGYADSLALSLQDWTR